jgi:hypothetical protein
MARFLDMARDIGCDWSGRRLDGALRELVPPMHAPEPPRPEPTRITPFAAARHADRELSNCSGEPFDAS